MNRCDSDDVTYCLSQVSNTTSSQAGYCFDSAPNNTCGGKNKVGSIIYGGRQGPNTQQLPIARSLAKTAEGMEMIQSQTHKHGSKHDT